MALETMLESQRTAAGLMGVDYTVVQAEQGRVQVYDLGTLRVPETDQEAQAYRVHAGAAEDESTFGKGGIRMFDYGSPKAAKNVAVELSSEMFPKGRVLGHVEAHGAKGIINVDWRRLTSAQKDGLARQYAGRMNDLGLADYMRDVPAGDVGTNGLSNAYAREVRRLRPDDPYALASVTGKEVALGGLGFRTVATGFGVYVSHRELMNHQGVDWATVSAQGFGNVGAWYAYFASNDPDRRMRVTTISEFGGTISTDDPTGFEITEKMAREIGDNKHFEGDRLTALAQAINENQPGLKFDITPDAKAILTRPAGYLVPMAMGDVIDEAVAKALDIKYGVIEGSNGPTKQIGHQVMVANGLLVVPDFIANGQGVECSFLERLANIRAIEEGAPMPSDEQVRASLEMAAVGNMRRMLGAAKEHNTLDLRVAASMLFIASIMTRQTATV